MDEIIRVLQAPNSACPGLFFWLLNASYQAAILIGVIWLGLRIFRIKPAPARFYLWLFALLGVALLPAISPYLPHLRPLWVLQRPAEMPPMEFVEFYPPPVSEVTPEVTDYEPILAEEPVEFEPPEAAPIEIMPTKESPWPKIKEYWPLSLTAAWILGAVFFLARLLCGHLAIRRLKRNSQEIALARVLDVARETAAKIGLKRNMRLLASSDVSQPATAGIFRPAVILPDEFIKSAGADELKPILIHEFAHIKRSDFLVNLFQRLLEAVFFFHPLIWIASRNLRLTREEICDNWVLEITGERKSYARSLAHFAQVLSARRLPATVALIHRRPEILRRIEMILDERRKIATRLSKKSAFSILLLAAFILPLISAFPFIAEAPVKVGEPPADAPGREYNHFLFLRQNRKNGMPGSETLVLAKITPGGFRLRDLYTRPYLSRGWWKPLCVVDGKLYATKKFISKPPEIYSLLSIDMATGEAQNLCSTIGLPAYDSGRLYAVVKGRDGDNKLRLFDFRKGAYRDVRSIAFPRPIQMHPIAVSPDHRRVAYWSGTRLDGSKTRSSSGQLTVLELDTGKVVQPGDPVLYLIPGIVSVPRGRPPVWVDSRTILCLHTQVPVPYEEVTAMTVHMDGVVNKLATIDVITGDRSDVVTLPGPADFTMIRLVQDGSGSVPRVILRAPRLGLVRYRIDLEAGKLVEDDTLGGDYRLKEQHLFYGEKLIGQPKGNIKVVVSPRGKRVIWIPGWPARELFHYDPTEGVVRVVAQVAEGWLQDPFLWFAEEDLEAPSETVEIPTGWIPFALDQSSPEATWKSYQKAVMEKNFEAAYECYSPELRKYMPFEEWKMTLSEVNLDDFARRELFEVKITDENQAAGKMRYDEIEVTEYFTKIGDKWYLGSLAKYKERVRGKRIRADCIRNLTRQIGLALHIYANDYGDLFPPPEVGLAALYPKYISSREVFICPSISDKEGIEPAEATEVCYEYNPRRQLKPEDPPTTPLAWDMKGNHPGGRNVLFVDGHGEWMAEEKFQELISKEAKKEKHKAAASDMLSNQIQEIFKTAEKLAEERKQRSREYLNSLSDEELARLYARYARQRRLRFDVALKAVKKDRREIIANMEGGRFLSQADEAQFRKRYSSIVDELANLGPDAVPLLVLQLGEAYRRSGRWALVKEALLKMGPPIVPHLLTLMEKRDRWLRANVASLLSRLADPRAKDFLLRALKDEDGSVRRDALQGLVRMGPEIVGKKRLVNLLIYGLQDGVCVYEAISGLERHGDESALEALKVVEEFHFGRGKGDLRDNARQAINAILKRAGKPVKEVPREHYTTNRLTYDDLLQAAQCPNAGIRRGAVTFLQQRHRDDRTALFLIDRLAREQNAGVTEEISRWLGIIMLPPSDPQESVVSAPIMQKAFDGLLSTAEAAASPRIKAAAISGATTIVHAARRREEHLDRIDHFKAIVREGLSSKEPRIQRACFRAVTAVAMLAPEKGATWNAQERKDLQDQLLPFLNVPTPNIRLIECLGYIGDRNLTPRMLELLKHSDSTVRRFAASALGKIGDMRAVEPLIDLLKDESSGVRGSAVTALGKIGDPRALPALRHLAETDPAQWHDGTYGVREAAKRAIQAIQERLKPEAAVAKEPERPLSPEDAAVKEKLQQLITFDFTETPFGDMMDFIRVVGDINIALDPQVVTKEMLLKPMRLKLENVTVETALWHILRFLDLRFVVKDGVVFISNEEGLEAIKEWKLKAKEDISPEDAAVQGKLQQLITFHFIDTPFGDVMDFTRVVGDINIALDPQVVTKEMLLKPVTLKLENVTVETALWHILRFLDLRFVIKDGVVFISHRFAVMGEPIQAVYDVRDVIAPIRDFEAPKLGVVEPEEERAPLVLSEEERKKKVDEEGAKLAKLIQADIEPEIWATPGNSVRYRNGQLIIKAPDPIHKKIQEFLVNLRKERGLHVQLDIRFIRAAPEFLEEIEKELKLELSPIAGVVSSPAEEIPVPSGMREEDLKALLGRVRKSEKAKIMTAPRVTLFNTQRGYVALVNEDDYTFDIRPVKSAEGEIEKTEEIKKKVRTGVVFDVRATISADRRDVLMDMYFGHVDIIGFGEITTETGQTIEIPALGVINIKTTLKVPDGETMLMGGLRYKPEEGEEEALTQFLLLVTPHIIIQEEVEERVLKAE